MTETRYICISRLHKYGGSDSGHMGPIQRPLPLAGFWGCGEHVARGDGATHCSTDPEGSCTWTSEIVIGTLDN